MPRRPNANPAVGAFLPAEPDLLEEPEQRPPIRANAQMQNSANAHSQRTPVLQEQSRANTPAGDEAKKAPETQPVRGIRVQAQLLPEVYEQVTLETVRRKLHARDIIIEAAVELLLSKQVNEQTRTEFISRVHKRRPKRGSRT